MSILYVDGGIGEACFKCRSASELWVVAPFLPDSDRLAVLCASCVAEIAKAAEFIHKDQYEEKLVELNNIIADQAAKLEAIPNLMEKVINGANNLLADFVVSVASITSADKPVQPKGSKTYTGDTEHISRSTKEHNPEHKQNTKPSPKSVKY